MKRNVLIISLIIALSLAAGCAKNTGSPLPEATAGQPTPSATLSVTAEPGTSKSYYTVEKNGRRGVVNERGQIVLPFEYSKIDTLYFGETPAAFFAVPAQVKTGGQGSPGYYGIFYEGLLFNLNGSLIHKGKCSFANPISNGLIELFADEKCGVVSCDGKEVVPFKYNFICLCGDYIAAVTGDPYSVPGKAVDVDIYSKNGALQNSGRANFYRADGSLIEVTDNTGTKFGLVNTRFEEVVRADWDDLFYVGSGLYAVRRGEKYGVIDSTGKQIMPVKYGYPGYRYNENDPKSVFFYFTSEDGSYIYDGSGKQLFSSDKFISASVENGAIIAQDHNNTYHYINFKGEDIVPPAQTIFAGPFGFITCYDSGYCTFYTKNGDKLPLPKTDTINAVSPRRFIFATKTNWLYGICDAGGKVIVPAEYTGIYSCYDNNDLVIFMAADKSGKVRYGVIDANDGSILLDCFDSLQYAGGGLFQARKGTAHGLVDADGKWIWQTSDYQTLMD